MDVLHVCQLGAPEEVVPVVVAPVRELARAEAHTDVPSYDSGTRVQCGFGRGWKRGQGVGLGTKST